MRSPRRSAARVCFLLLATVAVAGGPQHAAAQAGNLDRWKAELVEDIDSRARFTQQMVDQIFSHAELGFQEFRTAALVADTLQELGILE